MQTITPAQLKLRLENGDKPALVDVREPWEFETCAINGSVNIPMSVLESKLDSLSKGEETVVICHHGMRSYQVAAYMESIGFGQMINLEGGIDLWARTVEPDMVQY